MESKQSDRVGAINWTTTAEDTKLINKIVDRAWALQKTQEFRENNGSKSHYPKVQIAMDIRACHCNGSQLNLEKLLKVDDFNFIHDVWGIRRHMNRESGKLMDCFVPRCSLPLEASNA